MRKIDSILVGTDFSEDASHALRRAALVASEHGAHLRLLHVVDPSPFARARGWLTPGAHTRIADAEATLAKLALYAAAAHGIAVNVEVRVGNTTEQVLRAAEGVDLLVLGARGLNPLRTFVLGTTAVRLLKKCRLPMLVCKQPARGPYRRVLVPVELSRSSAAALSGALRVAPRAKVRLFHAVCGSREAEMRIVGVPEHVIQDYRAMAIGRAESKLRSIVAEAGHRGARVNVAVRQGDALDLTLRHEERFGTDLIVVRKHGESAPGAFLLGSFTRRVLHNSRCDVLAVPNVGLDPVPVHPMVAPARPAAAFEPATNA
jgi:nucleotide-binding universal stress UspA family protein